MTSNTALLHILKQSARRPATAYLFSGPQEGEKSHYVILLSQLFNCTALNENLEICGTCRNCQKIARHVHPDLFPITPEAGTIKIGTVRDLQAKLQMRPFEGKTKVVILYEAHLLTESAQNSLLKILEEPPRNTVFLLITSFPFQLLPTIRSRCTTIFCPPDPRTHIATELKNQFRLSEEQAQWFAHRSYGSLEKARTLAQQTNDATETLPDKLASWFETSPQLARIFCDISDQFEKTPHTEELLETLSWWYRDFIVLNILEAPELMAYPSWKKSMPVLKSGLAVERIQMIDHFFELENWLQRRQEVPLNGKLLLDALLNQMLPQYSGS